MTNHVWSLPNAVPSMSTVQTEDHAVAHDEERGSSRMEHLPPGSQEPLAFLRCRQPDGDRPRILDRDAPFNQSRGRWRVQHISRSVTRDHILPTGSRRRLTLTKQFWDDWFYALAYKRTAILMAILFLVYAGIVFFFAFVYLGVSTWGRKIEVNPDGTTSTQAFCDMDIKNHMEALYFSLSTMTTIGYGVSGTLQ